MTWPYLSGPPRAFARPTASTAAGASQRADPSELHQVLLNLCINASYAMAHQGGVLAVSPGMTGLALTTKMLQTRSDLPIVPVTGMSDGLTEKLVHDTRLRGLLRKPFSAQSLGLALQQALHSAPTSSSVAGTPSP